jgi:hypothetical protein
MHQRSLLVGVSVFLIAGSSAGHASTLEERRNEWAFSLSSVDVDDIGSTTEYSIDWSWIFEKGYFQFGVTASGFEIDNDDPFAPDSDGATVGPLFIWNWTPSKERATGFLFASAQGVGGDLGDVFDAVGSAGVGAKAFVGSSAAIQVFYSFDKFQGAEGFQDVDQRRLGVAIALYSLSR